ncbi:sugar O-acetyltransferase [Liquorilactobacillus satsumensis]|uniref:sugar O-acetyltransferase n=2 Tax=Liquorilactobacillus satsumensis TaxID=259059 RepID=UPI001E63A938|nr:sugar O-acetyltransferase [Liquorilactobacillus satsumensis]MCC7666215.1 galactoside O-acetyltransferase [Liquorilactobacillus satsumensis]
MNNSERKKKRLLYHYDDSAILNEQSKYEDLLYDYNQLRPSNKKEQQKLLKKLFAEIGSNCYIKAPLHAAWGGHNVHFGSGIYCNSNMTLIDDAEIFVGNNCMFGPNVVLATAGHPILPILRSHNYVYSFPIRIEENVWIGSNVQILPNVSIGANSVIGAGSTVTHNIPSNVVAFGSPCRIIREIGPHDKEFFFKDKLLDVWE